MESTTNERVMQLRTALELSQLDFANKCGLTQAGIWRIENKEAKPRKSTLETIAKVCGVDKNWLINGVGEMIISEPKPIEAATDENPWKDALVSQLKDENHFLKDQIKMMREMLQVLKPSANFLNGKALAGQQMTGFSVRV